MRGLPYNVKNLVDKAQDAALLAVEIYNKPRTTFRSGTYIVLMIIAWTALLHAIFERKKIPYFYKKNNRFIKVEGEKKTFELKQCVSTYIQDENDAVRKNIEFFIGLRNKIEHRHLSKLDSDIFGECQALLLNFEELLAKEFGPKYSISENLVFSLQFSKFSERGLAKQEAKNDYQKVFDYIKNFRDKLSDSIWEDAKFSFRVFLMPKISNNRSNSDVAVEFIKYDRNNPQEMEKYKHLVALVKDKPIQVANQGKLKPREVVKGVGKKLGKKFTMFMHTTCYRYYKVRPAKDDVEMMKCNTEYCQYDEVHKDYIYTDAWVNFLIKSLQEESVYEKIKSTKREDQKKMG